MGYCHLVTQLFLTPLFSDPSDPTFSDLTLKRVVSLVFFVLVMGGNIFYTTVASARFIQLLFIAHFFFYYLFHTIHRSIKQTHLSVTIFRYAAGEKKKKEKKTTTLALASDSSNDKGLWPVVISPVHGKTPHFALCCIMSPLDWGVTYPQSCS